MQKGKPEEALKELEKAEEAAKIPLKNSENEFFHPPSAEVHKNTTYFPNMAVG